MLFYIKQLGAIKISDSTDIKDAICCYWQFIAHVFYCYFYNLLSYSAIQPQVSNKLSVILEYLS